MNLVQSLRNVGAVKRVRKTRFYSRLRSFFPVNGAGYEDDSALLEQDVPPVLIDWPQHLPKPRVGVVRDLGPSPRWTKYVRFLKNNGFEFQFVDFQKSTWIESIGHCSALLGGVPSSAPYHLEEARRKLYLLERHRGIKCYPGYEEILIYEDKILEADLAKAHGFPFIPTFVSHDREEAAGQNLFGYPLVSKIVPSSGSVGVELVKSPREQASIAAHAFSPGGRLTHNRYSRQKNYVYFQQFVSSDGYDLRIIVVGNMVFGYYRKAPNGDFRASGMGEVEKRKLPPEAMSLALEMNRKLHFSMLVVDFLCDQRGKFHVIEFSPICRIDTPEQLHVDGNPGAYLAQPDGSFCFTPGRFWVHELAVRCFFEQRYLPLATPQTSSC